MHRLIAGVSSFLLLSTAAQAGTCTVQVLPDEPTAHVRVCDPGADQGCSSVLFEGEILPGEGQTVSPTGDLLTYELFNAEIGAFDPITTAVCNGGVVEL